MEGRSNMALISELSGHNDNLNDLDASSWLDGPAVNNAKGLGMSTSVEYRSETESLSCSPVVNNLDTMTTVPAACASS